MARKEIVLRVFVANPYDVRDEAAAVVTAVEEVNASLPKDAGRRLEIVTWRTHALPGVGSDPQAVINENIGDDYDIFVGLLWGKFGTSTPRASSGTEEEFNRAYARYMSCPKSIRVMVYFKRSPIEIEDIEPSQIAAVAAFRSRLGSKGALYWDFSTRDEFEKYIRMHLARQLNEWGRTWGDDLPEMRNVQSSAADPGDSIEEGFLELMERGQEGLRIAGESMERIGRLQDQMNARIDEKIRQLQALSSVPDVERTKMGKQIVNASAVDLEQFAKGISSETAVLSEYFMSGADALSRALTYNECFREEDVIKGESLKGVFARIPVQLENFCGSVETLKENIEALPRFTTAFNHAKRAAVKALDELERFLHSATDLAEELQKNFETLVSSPSVA